MAATVDLILASSSPRRRELLERTGLGLRILPAEVDETPQAGEAPADYVRRLAAAKCDAVCAALPDRGDTPVLAADTIVVLDREIIGKAEDEAGARAMVARLQGRQHEVLTAYRIRTAAGAPLDRTVRTAVTFRPMRAEEIDSYIASGEWRTKAGSYALQGIGAMFVSALDGSHTNVIGLPVCEVIDDLLALGALKRYPPPAYGGGAA